MFNLALLFSIKGKPSSSLRDSMWILKVITMIAIIIIIMITIIMIVLMIIMTYE